MPNFKTAEPDVPNAQRAVKVMADSPNPSMPTTSQ